MVQQQYPQQQYPGQPYAAPGYHPAAFDPRQKVAPVVTFREWMVTLFVLGIPLVGFVMAIVWAFDQSNPNRANYCKAMLILMIIGAIVFALLWFLVIAAMISAMGGLPQLS